MTFSIRNFYCGFAKLFLILQVDKAKNIQLASAFQMLYEIPNSFFFHLGVASSSYSSPHATPRRKNIFLNNVQSSLLLRY